MAVKLHEESYTTLYARQLAEKLDAELKVRELDDFETLTDKIDLDSIALTGQLAEKDHNVKITYETIKKTCMDLGKSCLEVLLKLAKEEGEIK